MAENFDVFLKTDEETTIEQTNEDILKYSKLKIKNICNALCLQSKKYDPQKTIDAIKKYLSEKSTKERILYSEVSSFIYGLPPDEQGNFATNIESLVSFAFDEKNSVEDKYYKIIIKLYDHFQLAIQQKSLNSNSIDVIKTHLVESMKLAEETISERISENVKIDTKKIEKQYITILGIFAAVVLSFVGGITFTSSVLQSIDAISIYRLLFVVDILGLILINTIYVLIKFICQINDKEFKPFKIKTINILFVVFGVAIIIAWVIDARAFADFIARFLPWLK